MVEQTPPIGRKTKKLDGNSSEITEEALKSPSMLKTSMDRDARSRRSPSALDAQSQSAAVGDPRNPFRFIEQALHEAKQKIEKMKSTPQILESLPDEEKKKKFLKAENKLLRENLKRMSDNVNVLIEKMNQESLKKKTLPPGAPTNPQKGGGAVTGGQSIHQDNTGGGGGVVTVDENRSVGGGLVNRSVKNASPHGGRSYVSAYRNQAERDL